MVEMPSTGKKMRLNYRLFLKQISCKTERNEIYSENLGKLI
jgi:hypothetical protein